jgi:hypothetical protein
MVARMTTLVRDVELFRHQRDGEDDGKLIGLFQADEVATQCADELLLP